VNCVGNRGLSRPRKRYAALVVFGSALWIIGDMPKREWRVLEALQRRKVTGLGAAALFVGSIAFLTGCEEMPDGGAKPTSERCDADEDWYINKTITRIDLGGYVNVPDDQEARDAAYSVIDGIGLEYEDMAFTIARFKELQQDLFATGLYQDGDRKWGIESLARPAIPERRNADPTRTMSGCAGVELEMDGREYLPQKALDRPLRLTE